VSRSAVQMQDTSRDDERANPSWGPSCAEFMRCAGNIASLWLAVDGSASDLIGPVETNWCLAASAASAGLRVLRMWSDLLGCLVRGVLCVRSAAFG
jgi:hypothetical protein